jgi:hypothetical protein
VVDVGRRKTVADAERKKTVVDIGRRREEAHEEGDDWGRTLDLTSDRSRVRSTIFYFPK